MKKRFLTKIALAAVLLCGCTSQKTSSSSKTDSNSVYQNMNINSDIFDTTYAYQEAPETDESADHYNKSLDELTEYNNLFDIYNDYEGINNLKTINDNAGKQPVKVDQKIIDMLKEAKKFYELSGGEFDITMGALLNVWHNYREAGIKINEQQANNNETVGAPVPTKEELEAAAPHKGWDKIQIDEANSTVYITDPDVSIDVGGSAKGYAAEQVAKDMEAMGISGGYVNVGRNIRLLGGKIDGKTWKIGVADPEGSGKSVVVIDVDNSYSIVTSGDYERYYVGEDGKNYPHIVDPSTLYPADKYHSVTIVTPDSGAADCLSTTLFTLSIEEGKKVLETYTKETGNKADAIWVMDPGKVEDKNLHTSGDFEVTYTDGLEGKLTW